MKKNSGMTLIELIIYLALFTGIALVSMSYIVHFWHTSMRYQKKQASLINLMAAHDLLLADIRQAPDCKTAWKVRRTTELIWQRQDGTDIGWLYEKEALFRIEGIYNQREHVWQVKTKNIVAAALKNILFTYHESIEWIDVSLRDAYHTIDARAIPREKLLKKIFTKEEIT